MRSVKYVEFGDVYARRGEWVTCEKGHPICEVQRSIKIGDICDFDNDLGLWQQPAPLIGTMVMPRCRCGAEFVRPGNVFHFCNGGWRMVREYSARRTRWRRFLKLFGG